MADRPFRPSRRRAGLAVTGVLASAALVCAGFGATAREVSAAPPGATVDCSAATARGADLAEAFTASARATGVPVDLLKAVSYLQSRWDAHAGRPSIDGGYGPMNLTDAPVADVARGTSDGGRK